MSATDSDRVLVAGVALVLTDGREVTLRYGMRSLKMLEDTFGTIADAQNALAAGGKAIGPLMELLAAGLVHEAITADAMLDLVEPAKMVSYTDALVAAFELAFPAAGKAGAPAGAQNGSTGACSTTSPPSPSGAATTSSGA